MISILEDEYLEGVELCSYFGGYGSNSTLENSTTDKSTVEKSNDIGERKTSLGKRKTSV